MADLVVHRSKRARSPSPIHHSDLTSPLDILLKRRRRDELRSSSRIGGNGWDPDSSANAIAGPSTGEVYSVGLAAGSGGRVSPSSSLMSLRMDIEGSGSSSGNGSGWARDQAGVERRRARHWERLQAPINNDLRSTSTSSICPIERTISDTDNDSEPFPSNATPFPVASQPTPDRYRHLNHNQNHRCDPRPYSQPSHPYSHPHDSKNYEKRVVSQPTPTPHQQNHQMMSSSPVRQHLPSSSPFRAGPVNGRGGYGLMIEGVEQDEMNGRGDGSMVHTAMEEEWTAEEREKEWGPVYAAQNSLLYSLHMARRMSDSREKTLARGSAPLLTPHSDNHHDQSPSYFHYTQETTLASAQQSPIPSSYSSAALLPTPFQAPQPTPFRTLDSSSPHYSPLFPNHTHSHFQWQSHNNRDESYTPVHEVGGDVPSTPVTDPRQLHHYQNNHHQYNQMEDFERTRYEEANRLLAELEVARRQRLGYSEPDEP